MPQSIAHFAYQPASAGVGSEGFKALLGLVRDGNTWVKISAANRVSETELPPYDDVRPMAHALIQANAERIMWGTDCRTPIDMRAIRTMPTLLRPWAYGFVMKRCAGR